MELDVYRIRESNSIKFVLKSDFCATDIAVAVVDMSSDWNIKAILEKCYRELVFTKVRRGTYPEIREWAINRLALNSDMHLSLFDPSVEIPGWILGKWTKTHPGKKASKYHEKKESEVATKRVVVKKGVQANLDSAKKFKCRIHNDVLMKFNPVRSVWECPVSGCGLIARPKADSDKIVFGSGNLTMRIVMDDKEPKFVLIADNNIALDLTGYLSKELFDEHNDMNLVKEEGSSLSGRADIGVVRVSLHIRADIFGLADYPID